MKAFKLDQEKKITTGFVVPENYFDDFQERVLQRLEKREPKVVSFFRAKKKIILLAAAVLVVALILPIALRTSSSDSGELEESVLQDYIVYQTGINQYDLAEDLDKEEINQIHLSILLDEGENISQILTSEEDLELLINEE